MLAASFLRPLPLAGVCATLFATDFDREREECVRGFASSASIASSSSAPSARDIERSRLRPLDC